MIQWLKDMVDNVSFIAIDYDNGAFFTADKKKNKAFVQYTTGDTVWFRFIDSEWQVVKIETHDGSTSFLLESLA